MSEFSERIVKQTEALLHFQHDETLQETTPERLHEALGQVIMMEISDNWTKTKRRQAPGRRAFYFSAEYLVGRLVYSNLFNLGILRGMKAAFAEKGVDLACLEHIEDAALGNGGLGRLAACFLDSAATLDLPLTGYGLRYRFGLFKQSFVNGCQRENADDWTKYGDPWSHRRDKLAVKVKFADQTVNCVPYDMPVIGYETTTVGTLRLWQCEAEEELNFDAFNAQDYVKALEKKNKAEDITRVLYPNDSTWEGKRLRVKQQYVLSSASLQDILRDYRQQHGTDYYRLPEFIAVQLNDTHPAMSIPELIRLLGEKGIDFDEAVEIVTKTCAYTNHTILAEALEKWPRAYLDAVVPQLMPIIEKLDALARTRTEDESLAIIDKDDRVHMAHMDIHFTHSTNGVAALHTEILKNSELHGFYELYPEKFNNKTNGITFRRWLLECDPALTAELEQHIGSGFRKDAAELEKLMAFADDEAVLEQLTAVKKANKEALADWLLRTQKVSVNTDAVFDIQSKRLHEYKRQQLNLLYLIHQYYEIKAGHLPAAPLVSIFGAKAAPAYTIAKDIIHALLTLSKVIAADPEVSKWLQVVFVENYNVTAAEKLIPACDLSEQISLASKEASGTGNMKFMLNGALTLGTMDGANVEISQQVGEENIYIFGQTSDQVIHRYAVGDYDPAQWVEGDANIRRAISFLTGPEMLAAGHAENLTRLHNELIHKDWFQTLPDFNAYVVRKGQALSDYACDPKGWRRKCLVNIAKAGMFSSDRTIAEYNRDIWHLGE